MIIKKFKQQSNATPKSLLTKTVATITAPVPGLKDNCLQYEMTTRDGFTIYLREWLKPDDGTSALSRKHSNSKQAMLMMPGFPHSSMIVWERQVNDKHLSKHYRMVTMEVRGHGDSSKPTTSADFTEQAWADDIQDAITLLQLRNTVLMSHSFSGCALTHYLNVYGDSNLGEVILTSSFTKNDLSNPAFGAETFDPQFAPLAPSLLGLTNDLGDFYRAGMIFGDYSFFKIDDAYKTKVLATDMMVPPATRQAMFLPPAFVDNPVLATVKVPAMVVHAKDNCAHCPNPSKCKKSKDGLITLQHAKNNYKLLKTNSNHASLKLMDKVGHFPQAENPCEYNSILKHFLRHL